MRCALCLSLAFLAVSSTSSAKDPPSSAPPTASATDYGYIFSDDPMQAGVFTPNDARIVVSARATRVMLIRPRTLFVVELLKSAEKL
jgi:hypothetical protein